MPSLESAEMGTGTRTGTGSNLAGTDEKSTIKGKAGSSSEKRKAAKAARIKKIHQQEDDDIMGTNDSSIMSKRSVSKLYYPHEPDFYEPVTAKFQRRHPLINRGYWLRMQAVEHVVRQFLDENQGRNKAVVNLGCGYDPLPWQFWHRYPAKCEKTLFVDVDYPDLVRKKQVFISRSPLLQREVSALTSVNSESSTVLTCGKKYALVGCDLRDLKQFEHLLLQTLNLQDTSILFVAEVSMTYMRVDDADALIGWANTIENASFCVLEQHLPDGPNHPFAATMLAHFKKLNTPLQSIPRYPTVHDQGQRFAKLKWPYVRVESLWSFWNDLRAIDPSQRKSLDAAEPFDEWEEFALFAGHYFLLVATNNLSNTDEEVARDESLSGTFEGEGHGPYNAATLISNAWTNDVESGSSCGVRRFAAAMKFHDRNEDKQEVVCYGGLGAHGKLSTKDVWSAPSDEMTPEAWTVTELPSGVPGPRMCHTITDVNYYQLMVGGRSSPTNVFEDCYLYERDRLSEHGQWSICGQLQPGRYRHCAIGTTLGGDRIKGVLVVGGKTASGDVLNEWRFWTRGRGWQNVTFHAGSGIPLARFGAVIAEDSPGKGVLFGGMDANGTILSDIWQWHLRLGIRGPEAQCVPVSETIFRGLAGAYHARFGANLLSVEGYNRYLLVGGVGRDGVIRSDREIIWLLFEEDADIMEDITTGEGFRNIVSASYRYLQDTSRSGARPLLVGSVAVKTRHCSFYPECAIVICGGGAVCFSFGSFHNRTGFRIGDLCGKLNSVTGRMENFMRGVKVDEFGFDLDHFDSKSGEISWVERYLVHTKEDFEDAISTARPVILHGYDIGPCLELWTPEYLVDRIGTETEMVVHSCPSDRMTFAQKNFSYVKQKFGDFMKAIQSGEKLYLRAVANKQPFKHPTKLDQDFPALAKDFQLPEALQRVKDTMHSSPLRISGPVKLWLHYDVLANVLCQIRGTKTMKLYPPGDVSLLGFAPGSSSSNIDVFGDTEIDGTHPYYAVLRPGDMLYIPPMWMHAAKPTGGTSIAVNVFFKNLEAGYAVGKDVYGNRDLQAYEQGRRDVEKMARSFENVPSEIRHFYLRRLASELQSLVPEAKFDCSPVGGDEWLNEQQARY